MAELTFPQESLIISKTDSKGRITYGNTLFLELAGYKEGEIIGAPHNIVRHPDMPKVIFKTLWNTIQSGKEINAYVINRSKNGDFYWVLANVTPSFDNNGRIVGYYSVRRKPGSRSLQTIKSLYGELLSAEKRGGIGASEKILNEFISKHGGRYDKLILSI